MKVIGWLGVGVVALFMIAGAMFAIPGAAAGVQSFAGMSHSTPASASSSVNWNSGNLCVPQGLGTKDVTCTSGASGQMLWFNFSSGELQGGLVTVTILGGADCINLNFHSFYTAIVVNLYSSGYICPSGQGAPTATGPGVNIVVNSEGDTFSLIQQGSNYATSVTIFGTTTVSNTLMEGSNDVTTFGFFGTTPGLSVCPSGITSGRVLTSVIATGSFDTFNTYFVDGTNVAHPPPPSSSTMLLLPPDGWGTGDYWVTHTVTLPTGSCSYAPQPV